MSSSVVIELPKEYGWVILAATASFFNNFYQGAVAGSGRKAAQIELPANFDFGADPKHPKAKERKLFNLSQRAHANYIENQPSFLAALFVAGLKFPVAAGAIGLGWNVARVLYFTGYRDVTKAEGKGRLQGLWFFFCQLALFGMAGYVGVDMLRK